MSTEFFGDIDKIKDEGPDSPNPLRRTLHQGE